MDYKNLTWKEFNALVNWDGEDPVQLIQDMTGKDYDLCMDESLDVNFSIDEVFEYLNKLEVSELYIDTKIINLPKPIDSLFGEKMLLNQLFQTIGLNENPEKKLIELIPVIVAVYCTRVYYGKYTEIGFNELCEALKEHKIVDLYPAAMWLINGLKEANEHQEKSFIIAPNFKTKSSLKRSNKMESAGVHRLEKFGDMNLIDDFVELFPAYKHDEVFELSFRFVIERLERNTIKNNIQENTYEE